MKEKTYTAVVTRRCYVDKATKETKTFLCVEIELEPGFRVPCRLTERTAQAMLERDCKDVEA